MIQCNLPPPIGLFDIVNIYLYFLKVVLDNIARTMTNVNQVCTSVITIRIVSTIEAVIYANVKLVLRVQHVMIMTNVVKIRIDVTSTPIVQIQSVHINVDVNMDTKVMVLENVQMSTNVVQVWFDSPMSYRVSGDPIRKYQFCNR